MNFLLFLLSRKGKISKHPVVVRKQAKSQFTFA